MTCNICSEPYPTNTYRCKLSSKLHRRDVSIADGLNKLGVTIRTEDEHLLICRLCNSALSSAFIKQKEYEIALGKLYDKSNSNALIGGKLKDMIYATKLVPFATPPSRSRRGKKRCKGTPRGLQKRRRMSKSSEKKNRTRTPIAARTSKLGSRRGKKLCKGTPRSLQKRRMSKSSEKKTLTPIAAQTSESGSRRGKKRCKGTPRSLQKKKKKRMSKSSEKKTQTPIAAQTSELGKKRTTSQIASNYITKSMYGKACRLLYTKSKSFTREVQTIVEGAARQEMRNICKPASRSIWRSSAKGNKLNSYQSFFWKDAITEARTQCPFLYAAIFGAVTANKRGKRQTKTGGIARQLKPAVGAIFGMLTFLGNPRKMRLLQELIGIELWLSNCGRETFRRLNGLGICTDLKSTTSCIDTMIKNHDHDIIEKENELEAFGSSSKATLLPEEPAAGKDDGDCMIEEQAATSGNALHNLSLSSVEELADVRDSADASERNVGEGFISSIDAD